MSLTDLVLDSNPAFRTSAEVFDAIRERCAAVPELADCRTIGQSEEGREILAVVLGGGERTATLIAGAHADEPVGPETLRTLILNGLQRPDALAEWLTGRRLVIVPHINPDGEARNRAWIEQWPDLTAFLKHAVREAPGRDLEFGFPGMRVENRAVSAFLESYAPVALHMSLHGMAFSEGAMLLIERHWIDRTREVREEFRRAVDRLGLPLHDHDRGGEKGFDYIEAGFTTTPEGRAMQRYFRDRNDPDTAARFHLSSMEWIRTLGGDPLCLVTELPLFWLPPGEKSSPPGHPERYLALREKLPQIRAALEREEPAGRFLLPFSPRPLQLAEAMRLQLDVIDAAFSRLEGMDAAE